jgi:nucleoside-triphosphatase
MKNVLVTGRPGVGKTSVVETVAREFSRVAGGFTTNEIREHGVREGFRITTLDGTSAVLAHVDLSGQVRVGKYGVDVAAFERLALPALQDAIRSRRILVIDEIGKMELASKRFCDIVLKALDSPAIVLATVMERHHPFADQIKRRPDVEIFNLTLENRNNVAGTIIATIRDEIDSTAERHG